MVKYYHTVDGVFRALGDPTRRHLVERLAHGPATVTQLARPLAMSLPAVVQHLSVLQDCGLVRTEKVGRVRTCRLDPAPLRTAETWFAGQRAAWEIRLDRLDAFLTETAAPDDRAHDPSKEQTDDPAV